jgi:hypothetical protein
MARLHVERNAVENVMQQESFSDEELTELALDADPNAPLAPDAVPWNFGLGLNPLPEWYMPRPMARGRGRGTRIVVASLVVGFLVIGAFGLCITSGFLQFA